MYLVYRVKYFWYLRVIEILVEIGLMMLVMFKRGKWKFKVYVKRK